MGFHVWRNADFQGTRGWFVCERCGHRTHEVQAPAPASVVPPADDARVSYPPMSCDEVVAARATVIVDKTHKLLRDVTPTIRKYTIELLQREFGSL